MNKAIIKSIQELKSKLLVGVINERFYQKELDHLLQIVDDEKTKQYIIFNKDRDV